MSIADLAAQLSGLEVEFLDVLSTNDLAATSAFARKWTELHAALETHADSLDEVTKSTAHTLASKINILSDLFLSMEIKVVELEAELDSLDLDAPNPPPRDPTPKSPSPTPQSLPSRPDSSYPPYIEPCYKWLLGHLWNPYPKKAVKQKIADETGSSLDRISEWFVDARRRMGWTQLLREEFNRKRADMVHAAECYFVRPDPENPLLPIVDAKFAEIQAYAEDMYAAKFIPSALSNKLSAAVKDLTPELQAKAREEKWKRLQAQREAAKLGIYPSPATSGPSSPVEGASRKRTASDALDDFSSNKRSRNDDGATSLPSPPYSGPSSPTSRKRRLSDADESDAKRVRVRATSDTAALSVTLSGTPDILADWFSTNNTGDTDLFKPGQLLDIKLFDPSDLEFDEPPSPQSTALATPPETFDVTSFEIENFDFTSLDALLPAQQQSLLPDTLPFPLLPEPAIFDSSSNYGDNFNFATGYTFDNNYLSDIFSGAPLLDHNPKGGNQYATFQSQAFVGIGEVHLDSIVSDLTHCPAP
ncbi:C-terminal domain of homeodomain 1-domain-containing protein [Roridomyces roridus]|uniref:C-terminal domain of homeodomain 1-domain-containing protein n=1 Tax=Roridomyces roridus TaxID=1738132 RepID=A0AAD7F5S4_9AGAR|nr:C-terminal domain of homeodomain 1-domain-containing protein [Roridomyces roridus]